MHLMPWEIDSALSVSEKLRRSSYYLHKGDDVRLDFILNLSDAIIDWDKSKLDKQFFIDKFKSLKQINNWSDYNTKIYEGNEMWGHLDAFRDVVNDDVECDAYVSLTPNIYFHNTLLFYVFRSMESINHDYYWITPEVVKLWDSSWDMLVNKNYMDVPYDEHHLIDSYAIEKVVNDSLSEISLVESQSSHFKWAGWFDVHSSKLFDLIMYPDYWKGYGPMDSFFLYVLGTINNWESNQTEHRDVLKEVYDKLNFKQYILKNQIAQSAEQFNPNRKLYEDRLTLKSERQKQRDIIESGISKDIESAIKKLIGELT